MIIRNIDGNLIIINRTDFHSDLLYHKYIYNIIIPFTKLYKQYFIINNMKLLENNS